MIFRKLRFFSAIVVMAAFTGMIASVFADEMKHELPAPPANAAFDAIKALEGEWEGTSDSMGQAGPAKVRYDVTSGGYAVVETIFAGEPHEMTSIYYPEGSKGVRMVHYCAIGNRPEMVLRDDETSALNFEIDGTKGISSADEMHIHALDIEIMPDGGMIQEWISFSSGAEFSRTKVNLKRKTGSPL